MSSKNVRLLSRAPSDPTFLFVLRILFFIAGIQVIAVGLVLAPRFVSGVASRLANKTKLQEVGLPSPKIEVANNVNSEKNKEEVVKPLKLVKKTSSLQPAFSSQEALSEKEASSKTVFSGIESGSQEGNSLGIISIQHTAGGEGEQILKIAIKAQAHEVISVPEVKVQVYFYDQIEGEVVASKSPVTSRWLNAPVDWRDGDPQLLEVTYQPDNNNPDAHYLGYIVAVYYKGDLQAYRADPPAITNQFPIKVYIGHNEL